MKFIDLFAGIGGFRLGMEQAGHECVAFCEIDKFARKSYKAIHDTDGEVEMNKKLQEELDMDKAFIEKVQNRIYSESDDWEGSIAEREWIFQMTDIAEKYLMRFKMAENGRRKALKVKEASQ